MKIGTSVRSLKSLEKTADKWFSYYIRLRDADDNGFVACVTCGIKKHWKEMDCGHFVTRNHKLHKYNPRNCNPQCTSCNQFQKGEQFKHGFYIDKKYGQGTSYLLMACSKAPHKRTQTDLQYLIEEYKKLAKIEAEKRGIKL